MPIEIPNCLTGYTEPNDIPYNPIESGYQQMLIDWPRFTGLLTFGSVTSQAVRGSEESLDDFNARIKAEMDQALASLPPEGQQMVKQVFNQDELSPSIKQMRPTYNTTIEGGLQVSARGALESVDFSYDASSKKLHIDTLTGSFTIKDRHGKEVPIPDLVGAKFETKSVFTAMPNGFHVERKIFTDSPKLALDMFDAYCKRQIEQLPQRIEAVKMEPEVKASTGGMFGISLRNPLRESPQKQKIKTLESFGLNYQKLLLLSPEAKLDIVAAMAKNPNYLEEHHFKVVNSVQDSMRKFQAAKREHVFDFTGYDDKAKLVVQEAEARMNYFSDANIAQMYTNKDNRFTDKYMSLVQFPERVATFIEKNFDPLWESHHGAIKKEFGKSNRPEGKEDPKPADESSSLGSGLK